MTSCISNSCPGCLEPLGCRCGDLEANHQRHLDESYAAGYDACLEDGYDERPMTEHVYRTHHRARWCTTERRLVYAMTMVRFAEFTWRHSFKTEAAYGRWFEREYGYDLESYLDGYDDAGSGLPSAVDDPKRHAAYVAALEAYAPPPVTYGFVIGPMPVPTNQDFDLPL